MNVAWGLCWGGSRSTKPCEVVAAGDERYLVCAAVAAAVRMYLHTWQHQMTTIMQPAICNHRFKKHIELRTQEQPVVAKHRGGTHYARNDPSRTRWTQEVPFIAACSHFTRKNTRFRSPASSPTQAPCNIHAAITMRFAASRG